MKKFSAFLMESSLFKIFIVMWLILSIYSFALFSIMNSKFSMLANLKIGLLLGVFISILSISIISIYRDRIKFLNFFEKVEKMIEDAESREDLVKIYEKEFQDLLALAKSREDIEKTNFIYRILKIKNEYVEK